MAVCCVYFFCRRNTGYADVAEFLASIQEGHKYILGLANISGKSQIYWNSQIYPKSRKYIFKAANKALAFTPC
ncbi:hypothetical protein CYJ37_21190 [Bacillus sp. UMB0728]|nr:hypothetical protein CYJ37_21190 [Bacillus sp. UMB0728]